MPCGRETECQDRPRVHRIDHAVIPEPSRRIIRRALGLILRADLRLELLSGRLALERADEREHRRRLLAPHDADPGVRPHPELARPVGAAAHPVVPGAEASADDDRELRHRGARDGRHHLRAVLRDAALLVLPAHHEAGDVLQEHQRHLPLVAQLDEVRRFEGRLAEEDAVVRDDPDPKPHDPAETADERLAVEGLELGEPRAVHEPPDDLPHVVRRPGVVRHDAV